jgi:hypothetical protein
MNPRLLVRPQLMRLSTHQIRRHGHRIPDIARRAKSASPGPAWIGVIVGASGITGALCAALVKIPAFFSQDQLGGNDD